MEKPIELSDCAKYIIDYLLRGYRKGFGVDLNDLAPQGDNYSTFTDDEWVKALEELQKISGSTEAKHEIAMYKDIIGNGNPLPAD